MAKKARYKKLTLKEISAVDNPAQVGARMLIMKRHDETLHDIMKYVETPEGARTFAEILVEEEARERQWKANQALYPIFDALSASIRSIIADASIEMAAKQTKITASVQQFLVAVREKAPEAEAEISKVVKGLLSGEVTTVRKGGSMPDNKKVEKSAEELLQENTTLANQVEELKIEASLTDADKEHIKTLDEPTAKAFKKKAPAERTQIIAAAKASDETIEVDGRKISKSIVGADTFAVLKSQQAALTANADEIRKANERAETAEFRKRAGEEMANLPGSEEDKIELLRAAKAMPEKARNTLTAILKAANGTAGSAFSSLGHGGGDEMPAEAKKASADFMAKVGEVQKRDRVSKSVAMQRARTEFPDLYEAFNEASSVEYVPAATRKANARRQAPAN